jgi:chondroitin AC lyase
MHKIISIAFLLVLLNFLPLAANDFNFPVLINRIQNDVYSGVKGQDVLDNWVNAQLANGSWSDLNYGTLTNSNASTTSDSHVLRLWNIAAAVSRAGHSRYGNENYKLAVKRGLQYWRSSNTVDPNWWFNRIYFPQHLGETLLYMRVFDGYIPRTSATEISEAKVLELFYPLAVNDITLHSTGANAVDIALHYVYRALLTENGQLLIDTKNKIQSIIAANIMPDNVYHDHGPQVHIASYGWVFANGLLQLASYLSGTPAAFETTNDGFGAFVKFVRDVQINSIRGSSWDFSVMGRAISRNNGLNAGLNYLNRMASYIDPGNAELYTVALDRINGNKPASYQVKEFNQHYWSSDYTQHSRSNYLFAVRNVSKRTAEAEVGNGENLKANYFSYGATFISVNGNEYKNVMPLWDWSMIPGTTTNNTTSFPTRTNWGFNFGKTDFVGGLSNGKYGISALDQNHANTVAKKSWFFFDTEVVCLGAGISNSTGLNVRTTLNQAKMETPAYVVEAGQSAETSYSISSVVRSNSNLNYLRQGNIAYYFPQQGNVKFTLRTHTGRWSDINTSGSTTLESGYMFSLWFDHGVNSQDASYSYIVVPGVDSEQKAQSYAVSNIAIAHNTKSVQAVYHKVLNIYQIVFYEPASVGFEKFSIAASQSCMVMLTPDGKMWVADPTQKLNSVTVKINANESEKVYTVNLPVQEGYRGSTTSVEVELPTAVADIPESDNFSFRFADGVLEVDSFLSTISEIQLINQLGQPVLSANFQADYQRDVSWMSPGVYFLRITGNHPTFIKRFVKS